MSSPKIDKKQNRLPRNLVGLQIGLPLAPRNLDEDHNSLKTAKTGQELPGGASIR
jgi:hypothetical protein